MNNYNTDSIQSLGILGGVRAKPASIGLESHNQTFIEILANAIDEAREGYGNKIIITKHKDYSISIQDFGRSIPMDKNSKGEYAYNKVFNELWSGGKYNNNNKEKKSNYKYSLGTNGCGATGTNYCSDFFQCTAISPNGNEYYIKYKKGIQSCDLQKKKHNHDYSGTIIHWIPSKEVFRGENIIDDIFIESILKQQSIINENLKFVFANMTNDTEKEYYYEHGIKDYILEISQDKNISDIINFSTEGVGKENDNDDEFEIKANIIFSFNNEVNLMEYYHNASFLENGGTPEDFIKNAFTFVIDKYIKDNNLYSKGESKVKFADIQDSLIIISDTYSTVSLYTDQVKKKIKSKFMNTFVTEFLKEKLSIYFIENPLEAKKIVEQILINKRANDKAQKTKLDIKAKLSNTNKKGLTPEIEGLTDCDRNTPFEEREIWICEGLSACQTLSESKDDKTQATFALRGRFISSLKSSISDVLKNKTALYLIQALGCGIEIPKEEKKKFKDIKTFNIEDLKFGLIVIATDMDSWGRGIALALITFFYKYMPQVLKENRVYLSISPRYELTYKDELFFCYNDRDKDSMVEELRKQGKMVNVGIVKGLGQLDSDTFWTYMMNKNNRIFHQVRYDDVDEQELERYFNTLMGEDIDSRKEYVRKNIINANIEELD